MFKISHESPLQLLKESRDFNDYEYALVHLFDKYPEYYEFYQESVRLGRTVILDNSAYELGRPYDIQRYSAYVLELEPTEFILPDYRDDGRKNLKAIKLWHEIYSEIIKIKGNPIRIGVVHGESYKAYCQNYIQILPYVDKIAFSFESFFQTIADTDKITLAEARQNVIRMMLEDTIIRTDIPHHILGTLSPTEFKAYVKYDWIESADTSNPIVHGILRERYPDDGNLKKSVIKMEVLMEKSLSPGMLRDIQYNIDWFSNQLKPRAKEEVIIKIKDLGTALGKMNHINPFGHPFSDEIIETIKNTPVFFSEALEPIKFTALSEAVEAHILDEAKRIVSGGRNSDFEAEGSGQSFERVIPLFNILTGHELSIGDGAKFMMLLKLVRQECNPKRDNIVDLVGYASILNDIEN